MVSQPVAHGARSSLTSVDAGWAGAREAWLRDGEEATLPIVDAHHHYWDVTHNPHPCCSGSLPSPSRYGDYSPICHDFLPNDYAVAAGGHRVVGHVTMEGEWSPGDPTGEARWMTQMAERAGQPHGHAAQVWLDRADLDEVLAAYRALPLVRSVRHKPATQPRSAHGTNLCGPRFDALSALARRVCAT